MRALGTQIVADLYDCDSAVLDDLPRIEAAMVEAAERSGAHIVTRCFHRFSPHGVSGVVVIAESHLAIHTWPEHGYAAVDLFTCGETLNAEVGLAHLAEVFGSKHHTQSPLLRGRTAFLRDTTRRPATPHTVTVIDGSLGGAAGDTASALAPLEERLRLQARVRTVHLADHTFDLTALEPLLEDSDAFVFATDTCGDAWGGPMERFLEEAARLEGKAAFLGKPAALLVTAPAVGGQSVLSRLQGELSALGCQLPPMSGLIYSPTPPIPTAAGASTGGASTGVPAATLLDVGLLDDCETLSHNLLESARGGRQFRPWRVDGREPRRPGRGR